MDIYERLFQYYVDSGKYFSDILRSYAKKYGHIGRCGSENLEFFSDIYIAYELKAQETGGMWFKMEEEAVKDCFENIEDNELRAATVLAHWLDLPPDTIADIRNSPTGSLAWEKLKEPYHSKIRAYFIKSLDPQKWYVLAKKDGDFLVTEAGERYEMCLSTKNVSKRAPKR